MFLEIKGLLSDTQVARLTELAASLRFVDGRATNPANLTKLNLQADHADPKYAESVQILQTALARSREFVDFAMPKRIAPPLLCRYEPGMKYGAHADTAIIQVPGARIRSDVSCTIFVAPPESYEGGELVVTLGTRMIAFKGPAGSAIIHPSTTQHEVRPVTSGQRLVAITFIEKSLTSTRPKDVVGWARPPGRRAPESDADVA